MIQNFSHINQVPQCGELIDIALSKTNRKTPTIVRAKFEVHRIRSFYVKKVKFTAGEFQARLSGMVKEFPVLEDIHPFYGELIGTLYDRDHYKIALGQVNATCHRIEAIATEHTRLINYADGLYRCKQLKKAALGRMATTVKKLSASLTYLEEVRQHLSRLPSIDTSARTLVLCGFPNVGKSTFMNAISKAHVDVQPYAFTTRNIFVGHFDYSDLHWQVLDTPGLLDTPLSDKSTVEMLTLTALAHLRAAVLFFLDVSETCGYSVAEQISLYNNLAPLLSTEILIVLSKADLECVRTEELAQFLADKQAVDLSVVGNRNVTLVRNTICDKLLVQRLAGKEERAGAFAHRIRPVVPLTVPEKYEGDHLGVHPCIGLHENEAYVCEDKYDIIPEFYNGKNVADFVDARITEKVMSVEEAIKADTLRSYDILNAEERLMYETCNNARLEAAMKAHEAKRRTLPSSWINKITSRGELAKIDKQLAPVERVPKRPHNKKVQQGVGHKSYNSKPKHLMRPTGNKFAN